MLSINAFVKTIMHQWILYITNCLFSSPNVHYMLLLFYVMLFSAAVCIFSVNYAFLLFFEHYNSAEFIFLYPPRV